MYQAYIYQCRVRILIYVVDNENVTALLLTVAQAFKQIAVGQ